jgi:hypothetical protein
MTARGERVRVPSDADRRLVARRAVSQRYVAAPPRLSDDDIGLDRARREARRSEFADAGPVFDDDGEDVIIVRRRAPNRLYVIEE